MQVPALITSSAERLKQRGLPIFCTFLTALCAVEGTRMALQNHATDARWGGWYLLVVGVLISFGIFANDITDTTDISESGAASGSGTRVESSPRAEGTNPAVDDHMAVLIAAEQAPVQKHTRYAVIFFAAALTYAWALPWVGFAIANALFVAAYLLIIDKQRWFVAVGIAVVVDVVLVIGMGLLGVFLPTGVLGLGF